MVAIFYFGQICWILSSQVLQCDAREVRCNRPEVPNGNFTCEDPDLKEGSSCNLTCMAGYHASNSHTTVTCRHSSTWTKAAQCYQANCSMPEVPHGTFKCEDPDLKERSTCNLTCIDGYHASNSHTTVTCMHSSTWTKSAHCYLIRCHTPTDPNGEYHCSSNVPEVNSSCQLRCHGAFMPSSSHTGISCQSNGTWTAQPRCVPMKCPSPPDVPNGIYRCFTSVHRINSQCMLYCNRNYISSAPHSNITCQTDGSWTTPASCVQYPCQDPPAVNNGNWHCQAGPVHSPGSKCSLVCNNGYHHSNKTITCLPTSSWSSQAACIKTIRCFTPPAVIHGTYECPLHRVKAECGLRCHQNYQPSTPHSNITCQADGAWTAPATCVPMTPTSFRTTSADTTVRTYPLSEIPSTTPTTTQTKVMTSTSAQHSLNATTVLTSASPQLTSSSTKVAPLECEVCTGSLCGLIPGNDPSVQCPVEQPYCMNHVDNDSTGSKTVTKSCASEETCNRKWWHETSDKSNCVDFNPTNIYNYQLTCTYCCTKPGCNKDIVPVRHTLFIGHD